MALIKTSSRFFVVKNKIRRYSRSERDRLGGRSRITITISLVAFAWASFRRESQRRALREQQCSSIVLGVPGPDDKNVEVEPEDNGPNLGETGSDPIRDSSFVHLRNAALQGGVYLFAREMIGMAMRVAGVIVIAREIGPHNFGIYAGASAFIAVVATLAQMGMEVYLIRQLDDPTLHRYNDVFSFLLALSFLSVAGAYGLSVLAIRIHPASAEYVKVFRVLLISIPLNVLWAPAQARIERSFGFRRMAWLELGGDLILYLVAVPLALSGFGPYSLAVGFIAWQAWLLIGSFRLADMVPRLCRPNAMWFDYLRHGLSYSASSWVSTVSGLANPIVVGRYFGATGVGNVALAIRLVDTLGFAQRATWRLSLVALSKVQLEAERVRRGIEEGMVVQTLAVAIPVAGMAILGRWLIPLMFGSTWLPALAVFAPLGVARVLYAPLTVELALLYSRAKNQSVVVATFINAVIVFIASFILVPVLGIKGFGVAVIVGTFGWAVMHYKARSIQDFSSVRVLPWLFALTPPVLFPMVSSPLNLALLAPVSLLVLVPSLRHQLVEYLGTGFKSLRRAVASR